MGLRNTLRDLLREPSTINLGLKLLRHLFTGEQLVDVVHSDEALGDIRSTSHSIVGAVVATPSR